MRHWKKAVCILLSVVVVFTFTDSEPVHAVTSASIREKEDEIAKAKEEVETLKSSLTDIETLKAELEKSKSDLTAYVTQLDGELSDIQAKIKQYNTLIAEKEQQIADTTEELNATIQQQQDQYEAMKKRIKFMYERSDTSYLEILFSSSSLSDLVNKADYIEALSQYDRTKLEEYVEITEMVRLYKEELEAEKEVLDEAKIAVEAEETSISSLIQEKEARLSSVSADISNQEAAIREYEAMIAQENEEIKALEKAVAEEKARLEAENVQARVYNGGMFAWPCPGYTRISDDYGMRPEHPIFGDERMHNGIDIAAPAGTAILAAYDGDVVAAAYSSSMGNYIMIDHGSGLYTIYMHCSALYVSKGQAVTKGQSIAAVGSTGNSRGNHLHFGVRLNGTYVNPWNYLG